MSPTVTVVIPTHPARLRGEQLLGQAVASVLAQTRPPDAIEIAIDNTGAGAAPTRQAGLNRADTDWVAFLDSDDLLKPKHLELMLRHAETTGADYVYSWFEILQTFAGGQQRLIPWDPVTGDGVFPPGHYLNDFDPNDPIETTMTVLVRTGLAKQVGMRTLDRGEANTGEDRAFTLDCLAAGAKISHLKARTWYWRHHWLDPYGRMPGNTSGFAGRGDGA